MKIPNLSEHGGLTIRTGSSAQEKIVVKYVLLRAMFDNLIRKTNYGIDVAIKIHKTK